MNHVNFPYSHQASHGLCWAAPKALYVLFRFSLKLLMLEFHLFTFFEPAVRMVQHNNTD